MIYTITGATGNIGGKLAESLLKAGHRVRVVGRDQERLAPLVAKGAQAQVGDLSDSEFLTGAFAGADGVFAMIPPQYAVADIFAVQGEIRQALIAALKAAKVSHVVALSSVGGEQPEGTGVVGALHAFEKELASLEQSAIKILRPGFFFENLFGQLPVIRQAGILAGSLQPDKTLPMIATRDIAAAAAKLLQKPDFTDYSVDYLLGAADYTFPQIAEALGQALGKPQLSYVRIPAEDEVAALLQAGFSRSAAEGMSELYQAVNRGILFKEVKRTPENTTATTLQDFVPVLKAAYGAEALV